ncbi:hypothetical protein DFP77_12850 [Marinomonas foliarum]|uniref:Uncharacterized protein n=3 Tax=Marinomonas TaxID=28253 RepID=A0A1M5N120_9GAMM|nr:hypothetical protein [Marinomonas vulgaris]RCW98314.1 hypothetical protein DFP77_12850 [Marinomonas foliarum]SHG82683.1 hypothetical protein SAMN02745753_04560 [Marinomonas polaris DSM 16579]|tara:strand:- start:6696 stop:7403 length:708 start_codon:yes stop_codon:yes gene_type:complete
MRRGESGQEADQAAGERVAPQRCGPGGNRSASGAAKKSRGALGEGRGRMISAPDRRESVQLINDGRTSSPGLCRAGSDSAHTATLAAPSGGSAPQRATPSTGQQAESGLAPQCAGSIQPGGVRQSTAASDRGAPGRSRHLAGFGVDFLPRTEGSPATASAWSQPTTGEADTDHPCGRQPEPAEVLGHHLATKHRQGTLLLLVHDQERLQPQADPTASSYPFEPRKSLYVFYDACC